MKLVCANDFFNTKALGITVPKTDELFQHENHVHQGCRFSIGASTDYEGLTGQQKEQVGLLLKHKLAVLDDEKNAQLGVIKRIDADAAAKLAVRKADVQAAKNAAAVSMPAVLKQLADVLAQNAQLIGMLTKKA